VGLLICSVAQRRTDSHRQLGLEGQLNPNART
jgi:hypothetical protein